MFMKMMARQASGTLELPFFERFPGRFKITHRPERARWIQHAKGVTGIVHYGEGICAHVCRLSKVRMHRIGAMEVGYSAYLLCWMKNLVRRYNYLIENLGV